MTLLSAPTEDRTVTTVSPADAIAIRQAARADMLEILRVERAAFAHPWGTEAFEQFLGQPGFLVAEARTDDDLLDAEVVGHVVATGVRVNGQPMGHVKDLAVAPDREGEGIGSELLEGALSVLEEHGLFTVRLEVRESNERAIALYERHDFSPVRTYPGYYPDGEDALILHARRGP
ncbi:Acetyltransferase (GNAT) family [Halanaeroarchaeum sp. HSR-CO]|uniref:GNAT family N-acetyltransferase n=1 Tax=Halanaeroarchaeum sp. HSR-CO TaxID=2866382 RepID=UPI00217E55F5|nr:GNAT family N-acetyltransferase [Halanaeroarchaeum sp. HSR-CO]UWG46880.1 Acetyltransferase (GNAT) family [Halanaeroarchaeum sp. HSR-CO]